MKPLTYLESNGSSRIKHIYKTDASGNITKSEQTTNNHITKNIHNSYLQNNKDNFIDTCKV